MCWPNCCRNHSLMMRRRLHRRTLLAVAENRWQAIGEIDDRQATVGIQWFECSSYVRFLVVYSNIYCDPLFVCRRRLSFNPFTFSFTVLRHEYNIRYRTICGNLIRPRRNRNIVSYTLKITLFYCVWFRISVFQLLVG